MGVIAGVGDFGITALVTQAEQAALEAQTSASEAALSLEMIENFENAGIFNANTGVAIIREDTETITAVPSNKLINGQSLIVSMPGNVGFSGINFSAGTYLNIGDRLCKQGTLWTLLKFAVGDNTITPEKTTWLKVVVDNSNDIEFAKVLKSGLVLFAVKKDATIINRIINSLEAKAVANQTSIATLTTSVSNIQRTIVMDNRIVIDNSQDIVVATTMKSGKVIIGLKLDGEIINSDISTIKETQPVNTELNSENIQYGIAWENGKIGFGLKDDNTFIVENIVEYGKTLSESKTEILLADDIFVISDRYLQLFGQSMIPTLNNRVGEYEFAFQSTNSKKQTIQSVFQKCLQVEASRLGNSACLVLKSDKRNDYEIQKELNIHISNASKVGTHNTLFIGDSLLGSDGAATLDEVAEILGQYPVNVNFLGKRKLPNVQNYSQTVPGLGLTDFIYENTRYNVLAVGLENSYSNSDLRTPFVRPAISGDNIADIRNGYVFDFNFYRTRFSIPRPDTVIINHFTNDASFSNDMAVWLDAYRIVITSILADSPNCHIGIAIPLSGWADAKTQNLSYKRFMNFVAFFKSLQTVYKDNSNVTIINSHAYLTTDFIFPLTTIPFGNNSKGVVRDSVHFVFTNTGRSLYAESIANFIHSKI